jgi:hypothetical protein
MVEGHRLAPVGHGETRINGLGATESGSGCRVFEVVEQGQAFEEVNLGGGRARVGKFDMTVAASSR